MHTKVIFTHCPDTRKWSIQIAGVDNQQEAREAFTACILTAQMLNPLLLPVTKAGLNIDNPVLEVREVLTFDIEPAVEEGDAAHVHAGNAS